MKVTAQALDVLDERVLLTAAVTAHFDPLAVLAAGRLVDDTRVDMVDGLAAVCDEVEVAGSGYRHWSMRPEAGSWRCRTLPRAPTSPRCLPRSRSRAATSSDATSATGFAGET